MKGQYLDSYVSKKGADTFIYTVSCTPEEKAAIKEAKGGFYREDASGNPLFYTSRYVGETPKLILTTNGNLVADMSEMKKKASLARQFGGNLGDQFAAAAAADILAEMKRSTRTVAQTEPEPEPDPEKEPQDSGEGDGLGKL